MLARLLNGGRSAPSSMNARQPNHQAMTVAQGDAAYDTSAEVATLLQANTATGQFAKIWEKTVPAQVAYHWGYGSPNQQRNQGYVWFAAADLTTDFEDGLLRIVQANAQETRMLVVAELYTGNLHTATVTTIATARPLTIDNMVPLPEQAQMPFVTEDSKMQLWFKTTEAGTTVDGVGFSIPATLYQ